MVLFIGIPWNPGYLYQHSPFFYKTGFFMLN